MGQGPIPIVVGVGDYVIRSTKLEDALEPLKLIHKAILEAFNDTGLSKTERQLLITQIDSISVVRTWTWPYSDLPGLLADRLGVMPPHMEYTEHGGNQPGRIFDEAARRIAKGQSQVALVTGGEALASLNAFAKAKKFPPSDWTKTPTKVDSVFSPTTRDLQQGSVNAMIGLAWAADNTGGIGAQHSIGAPIQVYPLFENGFRAHRGQSISDNNTESAEMYANFATIAKDNPFAWNYGHAETAESIGAVSKKNRMICFPYPLLMNAFNTVNLAAACLLTSTEYARELGIPEDIWIYPIGGAGTRDSYDFWERPDYYSSPSISRSIDAALKVSGLDIGEIDVADFYSCFPIVPKIACKHLGWSPTNPPKPITLLGGLTSFGGAGNNYSMHALTAMTRELRKGRARNGLVLANGGVMTYQHAICLSSQAPRTSYPKHPPLPTAITDIPCPPVDVTAEGDAIVETYTVEFDRQGNPKLGHVVGRLEPNGHRFVANHGDKSTLLQLSSFTKDPIGRKGRLVKDQQKENHNLFYFVNEQRL